MSPFKTLLTLPYMILLYLTCLSKVEWENLSGAVASLGKHSIRKKLQSFHTATRHFGCLRQQVAFVRIVFQCIRLRL